MHFFTENGENIRLTRQIGHGGEGNVFLIDGKPGFVAKIYHSKISLSREHKLRNMLCLSSSKLTQISAWPIELIKKKYETGTFGIILPFADGFELHTVYGPNERKQTLPEASWEFLLFVARNLSIAFDTIHSHNVVIGDVNEKNFLVDKKAIVRVIDCDSFQIPSRTSSPFLCTVGVEHYTPPELQGSDLSKTTRNQNHDCFGLAVLIFQLLFMARHPFAMYSKDPQISSLTFGESIKKFLYAYSRQASMFGISPPPLTLATSILPQSVLDLFEAAFSPTSIKYRPSASHWFLELDKVFKAIVTCRHDKSHKYCNHLTTCPWCDFSKKTGISFFVSFGSYSEFDFSKGDISTLHVAISHISKLIFIKKNMDSFGIVVPQANPIPLSLKLPAKSFYFGFIVIIVATLLGNKVPIAFIGIILGIYLIANGRHNEKYKEERISRKSRNDLCCQKVFEIYSKLQGVTESYNKIFDREREKVSNEFAMYSRLDDERTQLLTGLENKREQFQLQKYLQKFLVSKGRIKDIGSSRTITLVSYGIETAADVTYESLSGIPGFGKHLRGILLAWRKACEKDFKFDQRQPIPQSNIDTINKTIKEKKLVLQESLRKSIHSLTELNVTVQARYTEIEIQLPEALRDLKKAEADLSIFK